jgi:hypothetical protein
LRSILPTGASWLSSTRENTYDWLGSGVYFWEANPDRAYDWAVHHAERIKQESGAVVEPFVVGAVIDLGFCLDLINTNGLRAVADSLANSKMRSAICCARGGPSPSVMPRAAIQATASPISCTHAEVCPFCSQFCPISQTILQAK